MVESYLVKVGSPAATNKSMIRSVNTSFMDNLEESDMENGQRWSSEDYADARAALGFQ